MPKFAKIKNGLVGNIMNNWIAKALESLEVQYYSDFYDFETAPESCESCNRCKWTMLVGPEYMKWLEGFMKMHNMLIPYPMGSKELAKYIVDKQAKPSI